MAPRSEIKFLLADVDGTLVTKDKVLTERACRAVHGLKERGIGFAITSSRPPKGMRMLCRPLALEMPLAGFNGGQFVEPDLSLIAEKCLPLEAARAAIAVIEAHGIEAWVFAGEDWLIRDPQGAHVAHEIATIQFQPKVVQRFDDVLGASAKIVGVSDDYESLRKCEKAAQDACGDRATVMRSQAYYLDITHKDANKGEVLAFHSRRLSLPPAAIATIGDQLNDLAMFRRAGFSIAMGNAPADVQAQASAVTASCEEEGFAKAVESHFLGLPP